MKVAAAALALAAVTGCGGSGGGSSAGPTAPSPTTTPGAAAPITITIRSQNGNQSFSPNPASAGGQQVVFMNADTITHHVVLNGGVDTGDIAPGATSRVVTMPANGATYHCQLHPSMVGAVTSSTGGAPPPCTSNCGGDGDVPPSYY